MAELLGIPLSTYTKYEGARRNGDLQTTLPDELKGRFAELTGINLHWLITGKRKRVDGRGRGAAPAK